MNYNEALKELNAFRKIIDEYRNIRIKLISGKPTDEKNKKRSNILRDNIRISYGKIEDIVNAIEGPREIPVNASGDKAPVIYSNYIGAEFLSGRTFYEDQGYSQLLKIIGKVEQRIKNPIVPKDEYSITNVIKVLNRFRECCQYLKDPLRNESEVQIILWTILRSHFDRLYREDTLKKFGTKNYKPDFGIPELGLLIEVKFIGEKTKVQDIQEEILADVPGYLSDHSNYDSIIVFVYDAVHKFRDPRQFIEDLQSVDGIINVLVIPGIG